MLASCNWNVIHDDRVCEKGSVHCQTSSNGALSTKPLHCFPYVPNHFGPRRHRLRWVWSTLPANHWVFYEQMSHGSHVFWGITVVSIVMVIRVVRREEQGSKKCGRPLQRAGVVCEGGKLGGSRSYDGMRCCSRRWRWKVAWTRPLQCFIRCCCTLSRLLLGTEEYHPIGPEHRPELEKGISGSLLNVLKLCQYAYNTWPGVIEAFPRLGVFIRHDFCRCLVVSTDC